MPTWDIAQICENGHVINDSAQTDPSRNEEYCSECGSATITQCKNCKTPIRGRRHYEHVVAIGNYSHPNFCYKCGKAYPWTEKALDAAMQYTSEIEGLSDEEREILAKSINDIVKESPYQPVAITRFKKILSKATGPAKEILIQTISTFLSEGAKKSLGL